MIGLCGMFCTGTPAKKTLAKQDNHLSNLYTSFEFPMTFEPFFGKRIHSLVMLTGNCVGIWCSSWLQPFWGSMRCPSLDPHEPRLPWYHEIGCGIPGVPQADPTNRACRCEESLYLAIQVVMVPQFSTDLPIRLETVWLFPKKSSLVKLCIPGKHPNEDAHFGDFLGRLLFDPRPHTHVDVWVIIKDLPTGPENSTETWKVKCLKIVFHQIPPRKLIEIPKCSASSYQTLTKDPILTLQTRHLQGEFQHR